MTPEQKLFQAVIYRAVLDATATSAEPNTSQSEQRTADAWISRAGRDFRTICELAGMDPDFIADAYRNGRINRKLLKAEERK